MILGDPTTPGTPAYRDANRTEALNVPSIPSLPISWNNARALLKELEGTGSIFSTRTVRLLNGVNDAITPVWNTMAVIPGHIRSEVVVLGNHRDAWVSSTSKPIAMCVADFWGRYWALEILQAGLFLCTKSLSMFVQYF